MCLTILMIVFGIAALGKGEFNITKWRKVRNSTAKILGSLLLLGAGVTLLPRLGVITSSEGALIQELLLILVIVIGLITSEKIEVPTISTSQKK